MCSEACKGPSLKNTWAGCSNWERRVNDEFPKGFAVHCDSRGTFDVKQEGVIGDCRQHSPLPPHEGYDKEGDAAIEPCHSKLMPGIQCEVKAARKRLLRENQPNLKFEKLKQILGLKVDKTEILNEASGISIFKRIKLERQESSAIKKLGNIKAESCSPSLSQTENHKDVKEWHNSEQLDKKNQLKLTVTAKKHGVLPKLNECNVMPEAGITNDSKPLIQPQNDEDVKAWHNSEQLLKNSQAKLTLATIKLPVLPILQPVQLKKNDKFTATVKKQALSNLNECNLMPEASIKNDSKPLLQLQSEKDVEAWRGLEELDKKSQAKLTVSAISQGLLPKINECDVMPESGLTNDFKLLQQRQSDKNAKGWHDSDQLDKKSQIKLTIAAIRLPVLPVLQLNKQKRPFDELGEHCVHSGSSEGKQEGLADNHSQSVTQLQISDKNEHAGGYSDKSDKLSKTYCLRNALKADGQDLNDLPGPCIDIPLGVKHEEMIIEDHIIPTTPLLFDQVGQEEGNATAERSCLKVSSNDPKVKVAHSARMNLLEKSQPNLMITKLKKIVSLKLRKSSLMTNSVDEPKVDSVERGSTESKPGDEVTKSTPSLPQPQIITDKKIKDSCPVDCLCSECCSARLLLNQWVVTTATQQLQEMTQPSLKAVKKMVHGKLSQSDVLKEAGVTNDFKPLLLKGRERPSDKLNERCAHEGSSDARHKSMIIDDHSATAQSHILDSKEESVCMTRCSNKNKELDEADASNNLLPLGHEKPKNMDDKLEGRDAVEPLEKNNLSETGVSNKLLLKTTRHKESVSLLGYCDHDSSSAAVRHEGIRLVDCDSANKQTSPTPLNPLLMVSPSAIPSSKDVIIVPELGKNKDCSCLMCQLDGKGFTLWSFDEIKEMVRVGRTEVPLTFKAAARGKNYQYYRSFCTDFYRKYPWLSGCASKNKLFCFPCVLFSRDERRLVWRKGFNKVAYLNKGAQKHQDSSSHLKACYNMLSLENIRRSEQLVDSKIGSHNAMVKTNQEVLKRFVDCISFLVREGSTFIEKGESELLVNQGSFSDVIGLLRKYDKQFDDLLKTATVFQGPSVVVQKDLISALCGVIVDDIKKQLDQTEFVSILLSEIPDVNSKSQLSTVIRYVDGQGSVHEAFLGFSEIADRTPSAVYSHVKSVTELFNIKNKLVSQSYDGGSVNAGGLATLLTMVRKECPDALFVHSNSHELHRVFQQAASDIEELRTFFQFLSSVVAFFSHSDKRQRELKTFMSRRSRSSHFPELSWEFSLRLIPIIEDFRLDFMTFFQSVVDSEGSKRDAADAKTSNEFIVQMKKLETVFLLKVYAKVFMHSVLIDEALQKSRFDATDCRQQITQELAILKFYRNFCFDEVWASSVTSASDIDELSKRRKMDNQKSHCAQLFIKILDNAITELSHRFTYVDDLCFLRLLDSTKFNQYHNVFPEVPFKMLTQYSKRFDFVQLKGELKTIYSNGGTNGVYGNGNRIQGMISFLKVMPWMFPEMLRLCALDLTLPITSPPATVDKSGSTLERIKSFALSSLAQSGLSDLSIIAVEKPRLLQLESSPQFQDKVINKYAELTNRLDLKFL